MNNSISIIDTPTSCRNCKLRYDSYGLCEICILADVAVDNFYETNTKPSWCPLLPVPERKDLTQYAYSDYLEDVMKYNYNQGYNSCIDEILGENNECNY